jgi:hypothetical protein
MRIAAWLLLICWLAAPLGCRQTAPADPELARRILATGLDAWKNGESCDALERQSPPIHFRDPDWTSRWLLSDYRIIRDDEPFGQQQRCFVRLTLKGPKGGVSAKDVQFLIDTAPALVVVRVND